MDTDVDVWNERVRKARETDEFESRYFDVLTEETAGVWREYGAPIPADYLPETLLEGKLDVYEPEPETYHIVEVKFGVVGCATPWKPTRAQAREMEDRFGQEVRDAAAE